MSMENDMRIVEATLSGNGVVIVFSDERTAFYSAALLYELIARAREIAPVEDEGI
jgi:MinD-like ATPase involved in chromosome partitioning or flagellar assembly